MLNLNSSSLILIIVGFLCVLTILLIVVVINLSNLLKQQKTSCQDNNYLIQSMPVWIKDGITESMRPELEKLRQAIDNYAATTGDSQSEALQIIVDSFISSMNKKIEESATQYAMRIAQSSEQFNRSLSEINATVSVTLTDALAGFDSELQATLTELLETMKKLRAATNNIPKVIDSSFSEMQRSFDEMEEEMQKTISTFRDMRQKIDSQKSALGPVQPTMIRSEELPQHKSEAEPVRKRGFASMFSTTKTETVSNPVAKPSEGITSKPNNSSDSPMNFSNY